MSFKYGDNSAHFQTLLEDIECVVHKKNERKCQECKKGVEKEVDVQMQAGLMPVVSVHSDDIYEVQENTTFLERNHSHAITFHSKHYW